MNITFAKIAVPAQGAVVFGVTEGAKGGAKLSPAAAKFDKQTKGALSRAIKAAEFSGKREKTLTIVAPGETRLDRVVLVGLGNLKALDEVAAERIGAVIYDAIARDAAAAVVLDDIAGAKGKAADLVAHMAGGAVLKSYRFAKYRTKEEADAKPRIRTLTFQSEDATAAKKSYIAVGAVADGVFFTRDLVTEPANIIYPQSFVARAKELAADGIKVEALGEAAMQKLGMGALLGVGQGSRRESQLLILRWDGAKDKKAPPVAIVGKRTGDLRRIRQQQDFRQRLRGRIRPGIAGSVVRQQRGRGRSAEGRHRRPAERQLFHRRLSETAGRVPGARQVLGGSRRRLAGRTRPDQ